MTSRTTATRVAAGLALVLAIVTLTGFVVPAISSPVSAASSSSDRLHLRVGGFNRVAVVHDAPRSAGTVPALIVLHGSGQSIDRIARNSRFADLQRGGDFVLSYPQGMPSGLSRGGYAWNAGRCCAVPAQKKVDDVAFLDALIDELVAHHRVDPDRVYLTGFSNGAMMAYRYACERADRVRGIAPVSGALNVTSPCRPSKGVAVVAIHGTADTVVPYAGGRPKAGGWWNASVKRSTGTWAGINGCSTKNAVTKSGPAVIVRRTGCDRGTTVETVRLAGVGHRWPTTRVEGFDASRYIVARFRIATS